MLDAPAAPTVRPKILRDARALLELKACTAKSVNDFISSRRLDIFVDSDLNIYYKVSHANHASTWKRSIQEVRWIIRDLPEAEHLHTKSFPVEAATWESFQDGLLSRSDSSLTKQQREEARKSNQKVTELLDQLINMGGSDLHISANKNDDTARVRMRINGLLKDTNTWSYKIADAVLRAVWNNNDNVHRDEDGINNGSFYHKHSVNDKRYMVRMTESPTVQGTIFVARVRDPSEIRKLNSSGYTPEQQKTIERLLSARSGLISINGPTNSGKSTTQSAMIAYLAGEVHIVEIGDPVETHIHGVEHIELNEKYENPAGGKGKEEHLKHILGSTVRQDPDMLALTEMRDELTARAAIQLASQGKLVITTMHTTSFVNAFERLQRFGVAREDITSPGFLRGMLSQRLLPQLCPHCSTDTPPPNSGKLMARNRQVFGDDVHKLRFRNRNGCPQCKETGIISRVLCAEAVEITNEVRKIARKIVFEHDDSAWLDYAREHNIINIHQHAYHRAIAGEIDTAIAMQDLGPFTPENLQWLWLGHKPLPPGRVTSLQPHERTM